VTGLDGRERYAPALPLPPVAFLPGRTPRPARAEFALDAALLAPERWRDNVIWLHGVDLYNHGFAWECHEAWEHLWRASGDPRQRSFLQALIQCAASALKRALGESQGSTRLAQRAVEHLDGLAGEIAPRYMGLDHRAFSARFQAFGATYGAGFDDRPRISLE
jgi:hypothetical protein